MKTFYILSLLSIFFILPSSTHSQNTDEIISNYIIKKDYASLCRDFPSLKKGIKNKYVYDFAQAYYDMCTNTPENATKSIEKLLLSHKEKIDAQTVNILSLNLARKYEDLFQYDKAFAALKRFSNKNLFDNDALRMEYNKYKALSKIPSTEIIKPESYTIPYQISEFENLGSLMTINTKLNNVPANLIFDTGADVQMYLSESLARKLNVKIIADSIPTLSIMSSPYMKLGLLDSIEIGNIKIKNAVVNVGALNDVLTGEPSNQANNLHMTVNAVLGRHLINKLGEIQIFPPQKKITFSQIRSNGLSQKKNLYVINGQPFVYASSNEKPFVFHFDTGSAESYLSPSYYTENRDRVRLTGQRDMGQKTGIAGSAQLNEIYIIPDVPVKINDAIIDLGESIVYTDNEVLGNNFSDARIGINLLSDCKRIIIDFDRFLFIAEPTENKVTQDTNNTAISATASQEEKIARLINSGDYITINKEFDSIQYNIPPVLKDIISPLLLSALNKHEPAIEKLKYMISTYQTGIGFANYFKSISQIADELALIYHYKDAAGILKQTIDQIKEYNLVSKNILLPIENDYRIFSALSNAKPTIIKKGNKDCILKTNIANNLLYIPVKTKDKEIPFLIDTQADFQCAVSESMTATLPLRILVDSIFIDSNTKEKRKLGIIDSLEIGNITAYNVICRIGLDKDRYEKNNTKAVFGNRMLELLEEIQILPKEKMVIIPLRQTNFPENGINITNSFGVPATEVFVNGKRYLMKFDTGKENSFLSPVYYNKNRSYVEKSGKKIQADVENIKSVLPETNIYSMNNLKMRIGNKDLNAPQITVYDYETLGEKYDGSLSLDLLKNQNEITLNFRKMFLTIK